MPVLADTKHECVVASTEGQTLRDEGKLLTARERFVTCASDACPAIVRSSCASWLLEVESKIPSIVVRAEDAAGRDVTQVKLLVDGNLVRSRLDGRAIALDAGEHVVVVERAPGDSVEQRLLVVEREQGRVVVVRFAGDPSRAPLSPSPIVAPPRSQTPAAGSRPIPPSTWVLGAVGVVGVGAFAILWPTAVSDLDDLRTTCSPRCDPADVDRTRTQAIIADVALGVGVVALIAAGVFYLTAGARSGQPSQAHGRL